MKKNTLKDRIIERVNGIDSDNLLIIIDAYTRGIISTDKEQKGNKDHGE